jgi:hypothetical protein
MHESDHLVVTAVVTDPDGIGDVIGGTLSTPDESAAYGSFATDASEGAYSLSLSWSSISTTQTINTEMGMATSRTLRAKFFDAAGNSTYRDVSVSLQCHDSLAASCDGTCTDMTSTTDCGFCGHACPDQGASPMCYLQPNATCGMQRETSQRISCNTECQPPFDVCYAGAAQYTIDGGSPFYIDVDCSQAPPATATNNGAMGTFVDLYCACGDL